VKEAPSRTAGLKLWKSPSLHFVVFYLFGWVAVSLNAVRKCRLLLCGLPLGARNELQKHLCCSCKNIRRSSLDGSVEGVKL
jgi:hypothetical protein